MVTKLSQEANHQVGLGKSNG